MMLLNSSTLSFVFKATLITISILIAIYISWHESRRINHKLDVEILRLIWETLKAFDDRDLYHITICKSATISLTVYDQEYFFRVTYRKLKKYLDERKDLYKPIEGNTSVLFPLTKQGMQTRIQLLEDYIHQ